MASTLRQRNTPSPYPGAKAGGVTTIGKSDIADGVTDSRKIASGESMALMKPGGIPTEHGQEMDKLLDSHQEYEFGGPLGTGAMMLFFPPMMCECPDVLFQDTRVRGISAIMLL